MEDSRYRRLAEMAVEMSGDGVAFDYEPLQMEDWTPMVEAFQELGFDVVVTGKSLKVSKAMGR